MIFCHYCFFEKLYQSTWQSVLSDIQKSRRLKRIVDFALFSNPLLHDWTTDTPAAPQVLYIIPSKSSCYTFGYKVYKAKKITENIVT